MDCYLAGLCVFLAGAVCLGLLAVAASFTPPRPRRSRRVNALGAGCAALGCALAAAGWALTPLPLAAAVTAGVGNACFHVGGGIRILEDGSLLPETVSISKPEFLEGLLIDVLNGKLGGARRPSVCHCDYQAVLLKQIDKS